MPTKYLDLGCGRKKRTGAIGVDVISNESVDVVHDLNNTPWPFSDNEFDDILLDNSLEHLHDIVQTMEEIWRICGPGAHVTINVPYFRSHYAVDPTHRHYFCSHSFNYFDPRHSWHRQWRYSHKALFHVERVVFDEGFQYSRKDKLRLGIMRWFANKHPMAYEEYFSHYFPLHALTFQLKAIK
jgi:predicted SAM-dependent methyltransferase